MNKKAFSLIELIIAISILGLACTSLFFFLGSHLNNFRRLEENLGKEQIASHILLLISKDFRNCQGYTLNSSLEITLNLENGPVTYGIKDQKIKRKSGERTDYLSMPGEVPLISFALISSNLARISVGRLEQNICIRNLK